jgi:iron-sulfur cluster repair protein YtfE (RIC family)
MKGETMSDSTKFHRLSKELFPKLVQYVPVVDRVHGEHHPEFHEVRRFVESIYLKSQASISENPDLNEEFSQLQKITNNYAIPEDVCETYEAVFDMLKQLSSTYKE